ncbi:hypothetical protein SAMN04489743_2829 [Pseudarthrobacter equi]|uniref:Uncharacterized protein n=1 Tax=Pseudarthrobacter equi TaxID=728066 RepID=A0A1H2A7J8_9MICC|nr:hypothetical protein [Pseudarthrobacter equi]SDT41879.1 hypothetical protein SAMN04489743_2829 [Pseudarthrobacter equi]
MNGVEFSSDNGEELGMLFRLGALKMLSDILGRSVTEAEEDGIFHEIEGWSHNRTETLTMRLNTGGEVSLKLSHPLNNRFLEVGREERVRLATEAGATSLAVVEGWL